MNFVGFVDVLNFQINFNSDIIYSHLVVVIATDKGSLCRITVSIHTIICSNLLQQHLNVLFMCLPGILSLCDIGLGDCSACSQVRTLIHFAHAHTLLGCALVETCAYS